MPGTLHPTGGYDEVVELSFPGSKTSRTCYYREGLGHREDGPAVVSHDGAQVHYYRHGQIHRGDGPAIVATGEPSYWYRGHALGAASDFAPGSRLQDRLDELAAAGAHPEHVVGWLAFPQELAVAVCSQVVEPWDLREAYEAGIVDPQMLVEVAAGRTPISWALAGK